MTSPQQGLVFDAPVEPLDFIDLHALELLVAPPREHDGRMAAFVGDRQVEFGAQLRMVHVISPHRGGEIRGYMLVDGRLHLRTPCYSGRWPDLDDAVASRLGASVVPYVDDNGTVRPG